MIYAQPKIRPGKMRSTNFSGILRYKRITKQRDFLIVNIKVRTFRIVDFVVPADDRVKLKQGKKKYQDLTREHEGGGDAKCNWSARYSYQRIDKKTGGVGNKKTSGDHPNDCIIKISQNTKESSGDLKSLVVTQTPVRNQIVWVQTRIRSIE